MLTVTWLLFLIGQGSAQNVYNEESEEHTLDTAVETPTCPGVWSRYVSTANKTGCFCGDDLGGVVRCHNTTLQVELLPCYCMTPSNKNPNVTVVGTCILNCHQPICGRYYRVRASNISELLDFTCNRTLFGLSSWNRDGQLCGSCNDGFSPSIYSYDWHCESCSKNVFVKALVKYVSFAYLPLIIFFILASTLRIRANSPPLNAFIIACQVMASPLLLRLFSIYYYERGVQLTDTVKIFESLVAFWNLDFFRTLYPHFCLHPDMSTLQVLALDYIIAACPLLLIVVTYSLVELHDRNYRIIQWIWKPFGICFAFFQRQWNIRNSLIEAFVTFLLLSYVKFLNVSFDLLIPVYPYNVEGEPLEPFLYYDGTIEYFGQQHLPYAILAIVVLVIFNILPLLLLCFYPFRCFQKVLNTFRLQCLTLHIFMDAFQGCYKNGTNGTWDCRYFSAVYLLMRISFFTVAAVTLSDSQLMLFFFSGVMFTLLAILISVMQPYKASIYNTVEAILFLVLAFTFFCIVGIVFAEYNCTAYYVLTCTMAYIFILIPLIYMIVVVFYWLFLRHQTPQQCWLKFLHLLHRKRVLRQNNSEGSLPDQLTNPEECAALLQDPIL